MIFKQNILKEEKIKLLIVVLCVFTLFISILAIGLIKNENPKLLIFVLSIIFFPIIILMILVGFKYLEWYCIYDDHIEARNIYGVINTVYFYNVLYIEKVTVNLTTRGMEKIFYIFNDGRKNNNNLLNINSCYNNKKFNFRIYKTDELENYIKNTLKIKVYNEFDK